MEFLSLFQRKQKNTQAVSKSNASLERAADSILNQRGKQIVDGLNRTTARDHIGVRPQCWELSVNLNELLKYVL